MKCRHINKEDFVFCIFEIYEAMIVSFSEEYTVTVPPGVTRAITEAL